MEKLTKKEILKKLQERTGLSQRFLAQFVEALLEEMKKAFDLGEEVKITGFGTFIPHFTKPRPGRNVKTGEEVLIKPFKKVNLHLAPTLRAELHNEKGK
jgi:nucleoid DNA-binding protein